MPFKSIMTGIIKTDQIVTSTEIEIKAFNVNDTLIHCPETSSTWL